MPFAHNSRLITRRFEQLRQQLCSLRKPAPVAVRLFLSDHAGHANTIWKAAGQQRGPRGRTDATVRVEVIKGEPFLAETVDIRRANVFRAKSAVLPSPQIIGKNNDDIRL